MCPRWRLAVLACCLLVPLGCGGKSATRVSSEPTTELVPPPADSFAREKAQSADNLRQIGLALLEYQHDEGYLPHTHATPWSQPTPHPGLSWRFALLPWLGREDLWHGANPPLDSVDAWQSAPLREIRLPLFEAPVTSKARPGETPYRVFVGSGTAFRSEVQLPPRLSVRDFKDPLASIILVVEAAETVPWARPDELPCDPSLPLPALGLFPDGFHALMADGSVRFIPGSTDEKLIRAMITIDGGETVDPIPGTVIHPPLRLRQGDDRGGMAGRS